MCVCVCVCVRMCVCIFKCMSVYIYFLTNASETYLYTMKGASISHENWCVEKYRLILRLPKVEINSEYR